MEQEPEIMTRLGEVRNIGLLYCLFTMPKVSLASVIPFMKMDTFDFMSDD